MVYSSCADLQWPVWCEQWTPYMASMRWRINALLLIKYIKWLLTISGSWLLTCEGYVIITKPVKDFFSSFFIHPFFFYLLFFSGRSLANFFKYKNYITFWRFFSKCLVLIVHLSFFQQISDHIRLKFIGPSQSTVTGGLH